MRIVPKDPADAPTARVLEVIANKYLIAEIEAEIARLDAQIEKRFGVPAW